MYPEMWVSLHLPGSLECGHPGHIPMQWPCHECTSIRLQVVTPIPFITLTLTISPPDFPPCASMSHHKSFLNSLETLQLSPSDKVEVESHWQKVLEITEIAGQPIPHKNSKEFDIASFVLSWQMAMVRGISGASGVQF